MTVAGPPTAPRIGFVLEQSLGHTTHAQNLRSVIGADERVCARWLPIPFTVGGLPGRIPLYGSNWSVRAGVRARRAIRRTHRREPLAGLFVHTQVPAVLAAGWFDRIPTVVSIDATPKQYDALGVSYEHRTGSGPSERVKWLLNRRCFRRAGAIVAWSEWAKDGLVREYGVPPEKVTVIPPGVGPDWYRHVGRPLSSPGTVRILFVGGDLERKGGLLLLEAFRRLRAELAASGGDEDIDVRLDLVTSHQVPDEAGVVLHRGLVANSPQLVALYHAADVFCLPTRGDCLPMVLSEAGAAGLPLVSTDVGAIAEIVVDGETGSLVPVDDADALVRSLRQLVLDGELRARLGAGARHLVQRRFDAEANARRLVDVLLATASAKAAERR